MVNSKAKKKQPVDKRVIVKSKNGRPIIIECLFDKLMDPKKLKPNPANPFKHPDEQVKLLAMMIEGTDTTRGQGIRHAIVVSKRSGLIVAGHCRRDAAELLGVEFPVQYQDYKDAAEELAVMLGDNQIQEFAEVDRAIMGDVVVELDRVNYELQMTALTEVEIKEYVEGYVHTGQRENSDNKRICPQCGCEF